MGRELAGQVPLTDALRNVYLDTVLYDRDNLHHLIARLGADRVMSGTDYPLPAVDARTGPAVDELPAEVAVAWPGKNATELLGLIVWLCHHRRQSVARESRRGGRRDGRTRHGPL